MLAGKIHPVWKTKQFCVKEMKDLPALIKVLIVYQSVLIICQQRHHWADHIYTPIYMPSKCFMYAICIVQLTQNILPNQQNCTWLHVVWGLQIESPYSPKAFLTSHLANPAILWPTTALMSNSSITKPQAQAWVKYIEMKLVGLAVMEKYLKTYH